MKVLRCQNWLPVNLCEATFGINQDGPPCRMILCTVSTFDVVSFSCEEEEVLQIDEIDLCSVIVTAFDRRITRIASARVFDLKFLVQEFDFFVIECITIVTL